MKHQYLVLLLSGALPLLVAAQTVEVTKTIQVTQVATVFPSSSTADIASAAAAPSQTKGSSNDGGDDITGGGDGGNPQDPDAAGASGADTGAFSISKGGIAAIITVVTIVAVFGSMPRYLASFLSCHPSNLGSSWITYSMVYCEEATVGSACFYSSGLTPLDR
jgi:hypothetical protein